MKLHDKNRIDRGVNIKTQQKREEMTDHIFEKAKKSTKTVNKTFKLEIYAVGIS